MNAKEFVDAVRRVVLDASVNDTLSIIQNPPGRKPMPELLELSGWFRGLSEKDRAMVRGMVEFGVRTAVFGMLAVIDGARAIEARGPKGHLELLFIKDGEVQPLSGPRGEVLHELLE